MLLCFLIVVAFCFTDLAVSNGATHKERQKRSSEFPSFQELDSGSLASVKIQNTDCTFTRKGGNGCETTYSASSGLCSMKMVITQLFPGVNLLDITHKFINPEKFDTKRFKVNKCSGDKFETIAFKAKSLDSVEVAPQHMTLAAETDLTVRWKYKETVNIESLQVALRGMTSVGNNHAVPMEVSKTDGTDYDVEFSLSTLDVNVFLAKFGIQTEDLIPSDLNFEKRALGLTALVMQRPKVKGVFSPGGGFEIYAKGKIVAPKLAADAKKFYLIIQDFPKASANPEEEGFAKPIAGILALYRGQSVPDTIMSLTGVAVPDLAFFKGVNQAAITLASKPIVNINSEEVAKQAKKYVPIEGLDMMGKGLTVMHFTPNSNEDVRDKQNQKADRILFHCDVGKDQLTWTSPQNIRTQMSKLANFVWTEPKGLTTVRLRPDTQGAFVDVDFIRSSKRAQVSFNLTERVLVLSNGLVSLMNTTMTLFTDARGGGYADWKMSGKGKETIMDELVDVTVEQKAHRTNVLAVANIFDMTTLRNRTQASPLQENLEETFKFIMDMPIGNLRYEASFEWHRLLKFKGYALLEGKPNLELVYFTQGNQRKLIVALQFQGKYLHEVVNLFYEKDMMKSSWMKFKQIGVVIKKDHNRQVTFDRPLMKQTDKSFREGGIGFIASQLDVRSCKENEWEMCSFFKLHFNRFMDIEYKGRMLAKRVNMDAVGDLLLNLGKKFTLQIKESNFHALGKGDHLFFKGRVENNVFSEWYTGKIFDDGSNKIILDFEREDGYASNNNMPFARMQPVKADFVIPSNEPVNRVEFSSRLHVGTASAQLLELSGGTSRQYLYLNEGDKTRYVGVKENLKFRNLAAAFGETVQYSLLRSAQFDGQVVVVFNSVDEAWNLTDYNILAKKGLHFHGKLTLKTGDKYDAVVKLTDSMKLETRLQLPVLRYGEVVKTANGKSFKNINLYLRKEAEDDDVGPILVLGAQEQHLEGFCDTIGVRGKFSVTTVSRTNNDFDYLFKVKGNMYKEVDDVEVTMTTKGVDKPADFVFQYKIDLLTQATQNVNSQFRKAVSGVQVASAAGKKKADRVVQETTTLLTQTEAEQKGYTTNMNNLLEQIRGINSNIDNSVVDISTDCLDKCKTVSMPGVEWKQDCVTAAQGEKNMKCMTWSEDKEKVVNVMCVLKCEAKKISASGVASEDVKQIRVLVNRYREMKLMAENVGKLIQLIREASEIAQSAKRLVNNNANIDEDMTDLLSQPEGGNMVEISKFLVDEKLVTLHPPCLPFQLNFILSTKSRKSRNVKHDICFNGEFWMNVGVRILKSSYPSVDNLFKALDEAELRYVQINATKKSLRRVQHDIEKESSKRGQVPEPKRDLVENQLMQFAERRIPKFTSKGDKTIMAFAHYSPWATAKRSNPFSTSQLPRSGQKKYNFTATKDATACQQSRRVIAEYKDIADGLDRISEHYHNGKNLLGRSKISIQKDLVNSYGEIMKMMNKTSLSSYEQRDMLYWYEYTRKGMGDYLETFSNRLSEHNKRGLAFMRSELSSFYGEQNFVDSLHEIGHNSFTRSNIPEHKKEKHADMLGLVSKELRRVLYAKDATIESAGASVERINADVNKLYQSAIACY